MLRKKTVAERQMCKPNRVKNKQADLPSVSCWFCAQHLPPIIPLSSEVCQNLFLYPLILGLFNTTPPLIIFESSFWIVYFYPFFQPNYNHLYHT